MIRALLSATLAAAVSSLTFTAIAEVATAAEIKISLRFCDRDDDGRAGPAI